MNTMGETGLSYMDASTASMRPGAMNSVKYRPAPIESS